MAATIALILLVISLHSLQGEAKDKDETVCQLTWTKTSNARYIGTTIAIVGGGDIDKCKAACETRSDCDGFTYDVSSGTCYLFVANGTMQLGATNSDVYRLTRTPKKCTDSTCWCGAMPECETCFNNKGECTSTHLEKCHNHLDVCVRRYNMQEDRSVKKDRYGCAPRPSCADRNESNGMMCMEQVAYCDCDECASQPCLNGGTCHDMNLSYRCTCPPDATGRNCETKIYTCHGTAPLELTDSGGIVRSHPGYGSKVYPSNLQCKWLFIAPTGQVVRISFDSFELERYYYGCYYDHLTFYDGVSINAPLLRRYCGRPNVVPPDVQSFSKNMLVYFVSDSSSTIWNGHGFQFRWVFKDNSAK